MKLKDNMRAVTACNLIIKILRKLNNWNYKEINEIYDLAHKFVRENKIRRIK